jgi:hypothetical protein
MFTHDKYDLNSEGWTTAMIKNLTFSDLFIFAEKRAYVVATVNDAIHTMG